MRFHTGLLNGLGHIIKFVTAGFLLTLVFLAFYFRGTGIPHNFLTWLYALSIPAYYYLAILLLTCLLAPLYFFPYVKYLVIVPKILLDFYLFVNLFVFNIFRLHIDMIYINIVLHDFNGIGLPFYIISLAAGALVCIVLINLLAFLAVDRFGKWPVITSLAVIFLLISGQMVHIWGIEYNQKYITRYTNNFPYFFPTKAHDFIDKIARAYPAIVPVHSDAQAYALDPDTEKIGRAHV
jgi:uncharacterized protein